MFRGGRYGESAACFKAGYRSARAENQIDLAAPYPIVPFHHA